MANCLAPIDHPDRSAVDDRLAPVVWLLQGPRLGDNEQVLALGAALQARFGWATQVKQLVYRSSAPARVPLDHALDHVDFAAGDSVLGPEAGPRPDLVIAVGRRAAPVARWLKGENGIHVQLGRYQDHYRDVDLLVTTAQYALPAAPNVLHLTLPITARPQAALREAAVALRAQLEGLQHPLIGVLVGGPSRPINFDTADAHRLVAESLALAAQLGGTLLVATSPRTPDAVTDVLRDSLKAPHRLFPFAREAGEGQVNPYLALLALCDRFVVTTDSVSMLADACLTGRETHLFELPVTPPRTLWKPGFPLQWAGRRRLGRLNRGIAADPLDRWFEAQVRAGLAQPSRYVPILSNHLLRQGLVGRLAGQQARDSAEMPIRTPTGTKSGLADLAAREREMVLARIDALIAEKHALSQRRILCDAGSTADFRAGEAYPARLEYCRREYLLAEG